MGTPLTINGFQLSTNPVKFSAYRSAAQAFIGSATTQIPFDAVEFDTGSNFTTGAAAKFTAPVAGFYWFVANIEAGAITPTRLFLSLFKNGSEFKRGVDIAAASQGTNVTALMQLVAGDTVDVRYFSSTAGGSMAGQAFTYFSGYLVSLN